MSEPVTLSQVAGLAAQLPEAERRQLAVDILRDLAPARPEEAPRLWRDIHGLFPHPLCGEDAQAWVSRSRRESDDRREHLPGQQS